MTRPSGERVLLIETGDGGHRLVYIRLLADAALARGHQVLLGMPGTVLDSGSFLKHLGEISDKVLVVRLASSRLRRDELAVLARRELVDHIIVPHADDFAARELSRGWRGPRITALIMRDPRGEKACLRRRLSNLAKLVALSIAGRRASVRLVWLGQFGDATEHRRARLVAFDPFISDASTEETYGQARLLRESLGLDRDIFWFAMIGALSRRKNVQLVAEALAAVVATTPGRRAGLLLYGPVDRDLAHDRDGLLGQLPAGLRVVVDDGLKSNQEINAAVAAADCVVTAYSVHYPNSTLIKSQALGRSCVLAGTGYMRRRAAALANVFLADLSVAGLHSAMREAMMAAPPPARSDLGAEQFVDTLFGDAGKAS